MDLSAITSSIATAIAQNADLTTWSNTNFSKTHTVFIDLDIRNLPGEESCPYVVVTPLTKAVDQERRTKNHEIGFICIVYSDSGPVKVGTNLYKYTGSALVETFRKKIETIVNTTVTSPISVDVSTDAIESYPFIKSEMVIGITEHITIGTDPLL